MWESAIGSVADACQAYNQQLNQQRMNLLAMQANMMIRTPMPIRVQLKLCSYCRSNVPCESNCKNCGAPL